MGIHGLAAFAKKHATVSTASLLAPAGTGERTLKLALDASVFIHAAVAAFANDADAVADLTSCIESALAGAVRPLDALQRGLTSSHTRALINYYKRKVRTLEVSLCARILHVFDGRPLPAKAATAARRSSIRDEKVHAIEELVRDFAKMDRHERPPASAHAACIAKALVASMETTQVAELIMSNLNPRQWLRAPYEADAQIAHLCSQLVVDGVITTDSDMYVYGVERVFLWSAEYDCVHDTRRSKLLSALGLDDESFIDACVLAGSDYSLGIMSLEAAAKALQPSPPGVAAPSRTTGLALAQAASAGDAFQLARAVFRHQPVWDVWPATTVDLTGKACVYTIASESTPVPRAFVPLSMDKELRVAIGCDPAPDLVPLQVGGMISVPSEGAAAAAAAEVCASSPVPLTFETFMSEKPASVAVPKGMVCMPALSIDDVVTMLTQRRAGSDASSMLAAAAQAPLPSSGRMSVAHSGSRHEWPT